MMRKGTLALVVAAPLGLAACAGNDAPPPPQAAAVPSATTAVPGATPPSVAAGPTDMRSRQLLALDVDGNGMIDRNEWLNGRQATFVLLDYNNDGVVEQGEYLAATQAMRDATSPGGTAMLGSTGSTGAMGTAGGTSTGVVGTIDRPVQSPIGVDPEMQRRLDTFAALDRNQDSLLAQEEFVLGANQLFETMDSNRDGMLDMGEMNRPGPASGTGLAPMR